MKGVDQIVIELEQWFAPGDDDETGPGRVTPKCRYVISERSGVGKLPPALAVGSDEVGVAKAAVGARPVDLAARPQIAPGEAHEHRAPARLRAFALQRQKRLFHRVGHA